MSEILWSMAVDQDRNPTDPVPPSGWGSLGRWGKAIAIGGGAVVLAGLVAGWWGYSLLRRELPQFLQDNLSVALGRPIKVGEFERFSPTGVRLGPSIVPPTEDNFSWVKARALEVNFNPLELIWTRTLRPSLVFIEPQMAVKQGFDGDWRVLPPGSIGQRGWIKTELRSLQIRNAALAIGPISRSSIVELPPGVTSATLILLENVNLRLRFSGTNNQTATLIVGGRLNQGSFQARGEGQLDTLQTNLAIQAQQIPIESVNPLFGGGFFVREGLLSANLDLKVRPRAPEPLTVTGTARLRNGDIVITDLPAPLQEINGTLIATGLGGRLEHSSLKLGPILARAEGTIDLRQGNNLFITLPDVSLAQVEAVLGQPLPLEAVGRFRVETQVTGALDNPQLTGRLDALDQVRVDRLGLDAIQAQFTANLGGFTLTQAMVRPAPGGTLTAQGTADFNRADWRRPSLSFAVQTDLPLDSLAQLYEVPIPNPIQLGPLLAEAQITGYPNDLRGRVDWRLPQATFPGQGQVTYAQGVIQAPKALFQVGEGRLQAQAEVNLNNLNWQAHGVGADLSLGLLSPQLRGRLDTDVRVSGNLRHLTPAAMGATGQIQLSQAIPLHREGVDRLLPGPLQARFIWNGQRLEVPEASAPNFYARGGADITFAAGGGRPTISGMDFTTRFTHLNLAVAYALLDGPTWLRPQGYVDFDGTLRGFLGNPQIAGIAGLRQFSINDLAWFEEVSGPIRASLTEGAQLSLLGAGNEISADIDPSLRPNTFRLSNGEFLVTGQRQGSILEAEVRHFDLGRLAIRPFESPDIGLNLGTLSGLLHATAQIDLSELFNPAIAADLVVDRPGLGVITADRLTGQLHYREGLVLLTGGNLQLTPNTRFLITGQGRLFPEWQVSAAISTPQADFQDILHTLRLYSYADFGRLLRPPTPGSGADLAVTPVGMPEAALLDQATLARALRDLGQMVDQQQARALLPSLDQLEGQVSGRLGVAVDPRAGLSADFEFSGQNWAWGRYDFDNQFLARGEVHHQTLVLDPVEFRAGATRLSLVGQVSAQDSNLTIQAESVPLTAAANLLETPFEVNGLLNLKANLTGSYTNPNLVGSFAVDQASINQQDIQDISSTFQYQDAYFSLSGRILGPAAEPLLFSGRVPYALPFMTVKPEGNEIALQASLKDEALSLVSVITPELLWGGGTARIDLRIGGSLSRPLANGQITFDQATFNLPSFEVSLNNLSGDIQLLGTQVQVGSLTGNLLDGNFALTGNLPLTIRDVAPTDQGLQLALDNIHLEFFNEVSSYINGTLTVTNALLAPTLGGDVRLQNTQVTVGPQLLNLVQDLRRQTSVAEIRADLARVTRIFPVRVKDLQVALEPTLVKAPPLLSFNLQGALALSGPIPGLYANGRIDLEEGWVNTITAEFFLQNGYDNVILFRPEYKLDPYLDLVMEASVPLQRSYAINRPQITEGAAEIPAIDRLGSNTIFDELLIEARVKGLASRFFENLQLTSNPPYSQTQLLSMVSGGYLSDLGGAEPSLALGANLITALTADTQDAIGRALGVRRFRLGASTIQPTPTGDTFGYGLGLNLGISDNLSLNFVQVLNQAQPSQLNARYRFDQHWSLEGSSSLGDDHRIFVRYRLSF